MKDKQAAAVQAVAWVVHAPNGNVRLWSHDQHEAARCADANGLTVTPLYAAPPSSLLEQAVKALEIGRDAAAEVAATFHEAMRGYRPHEHKQVDADVAEIDATLAALREALKGQQ